MKYLSLMSLMLALAAFAAAPSYAQSMPDNDADAVMVIEEEVVATPSDCGSKASGTQASSDNGDEEVVVEEDEVMED